MDHGLPVVFVSHTTRDLRDANLAHGLAKGLRSCGAEVWIAPDSIPPGEEWEPQVVAGVMDRCSHFLVIVSAAAIQADWVLKEIRLAKERHDGAGNITILSLVVGQVEKHEWTDFLERFQKVPVQSRFFEQLERVASCMGLPLPVRKVWNRIWRRCGTTAPIFPI